VKNIEGKRKGKGEEAIQKRGPMLWLAGDRLSPARGSAA
jgi:hypothetical protein